MVSKLLILAALICALCASSCCATGATDTPENLRETQLNIPN
jgi:hypothetical protein